MKKMNDKTEDNHSIEGPNVSQASKSNILTPEEQDRKKAELLLEKFKTIKNTVNANEEELEEILKSHATGFKEILES